MLDNVNKSAALPVTRRFANTFTEYEWRDVVVNHKPKKTMRCRVPSTWSDNAASTLMSKYAVRAGVSDEMGGVAGREVDAERIFDRLVAGWRAAAIEHGYWHADSPHLAKFCAEIKAMLEQQVAAPNSPQWFNTGVAVQYGIQAGSDGHYFATVDAHGTATAHACSDSLAHPQISACFIQHVDDKLVGEGGIMDLWEREARLFKYGSGSGANYSNLRGKGESLSRGGASSGLLSFLRVGDRSAGAIKSAGTTRRAAKMVIVDDDHPDIEDFVAWKPREDAKIRALHKAGIGDPNDFEDEATDTVSGQNANNSVSVSDAFMQAVIDDAPWDLHARTDGRVMKTVRAAALWDRIVDAAWTCADPGLQFRGTLNTWHTCKTDGPIRGSNPCQPAFAPVLTPDGIRTMGDIEVGDTVWSGQQWTKVKRKIATGIKQVHVYHTTAGRVICTQEHRVFQEGERIPAAEADTIDTVQGPRTEHIDSLDPQDVMDGLYFGDGSYRADAVEGQRCMLAIGKDDGCYHESEVGHLIVVAKTGYNYCSWAVSSTIGALPYTYERVVPEQFYQGNTRKVRGFLRGLYSANGSIVGQGKRGRVTLKAASFAVICAVQEMLSALGIRSYYTTNKANEVEFANGTYLCKQSYDLNITSDVARFAELIGFVHPYKADKLTALVATRQDVGRHKYATRTAKTTYAIKRVEDLGTMPVFDIEVEADEHSYWSGGHLISNCSEYVFLDDTACNLASLNLAKFVVTRDDDTREIDWTAYEHAVRLWTIVLDVSVSMAGYPTAEIARRSMLYRTLGLGYAALGEALVLLGLGYGAEKGRRFAAEATSRLTCVAYLTSAELSRHLGSFPRYAANSDDMLAVLNQHFAAAQGLFGVHSACAMAWGAAVHDVLTHGARNAQVSLLAPTGTIGIVMDCETTGVEPYYSDTTVKALAGGGVLVLAAKRWAEVMRERGYDPEEYTRREWTVEDGEVKSYVWVDPPAELAELLVCASTLTPQQHVDMMAAVQPFLSGAISKTVNMPSTATRENVSAMYLHAWRSGLKSIAIYRDGCKPTQPLQGRTPAPGAVTYPTREAADAALAKEQLDDYVDAVADAAPGEAARMSQRGIVVDKLVTKMEYTCDAPDQTRRVAPPVVTLTFQGETIELARGERELPPDDSNAHVVRLELAGHTFYLTLSEHRDGRLAAVFVTMPRTGSAVSGWVNAWAKQFSLALQHGVPLDVLTSAARGEQFEPCGYLNGRPVSSPIDAFAKVIEARYLADDPEHAPTIDEGPRPAPAKVRAQASSAKPTGNTCSSCGSLDLRRSGSCFVCGACGTTTGCS